MNSHETTELKFWNDLVRSHGTVENFIKFRETEHDFKVGKFPSFKKQKGAGLDLGAGCVSALNGCKKRVVAIDPLMDEYLRIVPEVLLSIPHLKGDGEDLNFANDSLDWVLCNNVIDHTPNPQKMMDEIHRVLKPGGILYFQVNFDDHLTPAHYALWNVDMVAEHTQNFNKEWELIERNPDYPQWLYYGEFICKK